MASRWRNVSYNNQLGHIQFPHLLKAPMAQGKRVKLNKRVDRDAVWWKPGRALKSSSIFAYPHPLPLREVKVMDVRVGGSI
jgi:hypothetical protein